MAFSLAYGARTFASASALLQGHPLWHFLGAFLAPLAVAMVVRLQVGRKQAPARMSPVRSWFTRARKAPLLVKGLAIGAALTAGIHTSVCPEHFRENALYGTFFVLLATSQAGWAALVLARPKRWVLAAGAAINLGTIVVWLVSRTSGLPFGPEAWQRESFGRLDITASILELLVATGAIYATGRLADVESLGSLHRLRALLPVGTPLPEEIWRQRHRWIRGVLSAHLPTIAVFAILRGKSMAVALVMPAVLGVFVLAAYRLTSRRRVTTVLTAVGLLSCSAELVYLSGGSIEMHFHYFVMVGIITLYQDWWPFLVAIGYVVLQHGLAGVLDPSAVYDHESAITHPWTWAAIHGVFVVAMSAAGMASWRLNEAFLSELSSGEKMLRSTLSLLNATLDSTADGILVVDNSGRISSYNQRFIDLWSIPAAVLASRDDNEALGFVVGQLIDPDAFLAKVRDLYAQPEADSHDVLFFKDGRVFDRFSHPQRVDGDVVGRVWSFRDITAQHRLEEELAHQAFHDSLTNLANQALFRDRVDHALARVERRGGIAAVLFLDLDRFKTVNDSLGHLAGDELLVAMAERLRRCLRQTDTAARLGGDEFAILIEDLAQDDEAVGLAERIRACLLSPFSVGGLQVVIDASIGIAFASRGATTDQLLRDADLAMYSAKRRGGGHQIFRADMHARAVERLEMEADMRAGLVRDEFSVVYQPIVAAADGVAVGVEALVRWEHPTRGQLSPVAFIPVAEETGLIHQLGLTVLRKACQQTRLWQSSGAPELTLSVNLSPQQLRHSDLVADVASVLDESGLAPEYLTLEITETAMLGEGEATIERLHQLKRLGVSLAVDDFGTGYSSLSYLERLPIDILKIDRSFVAPITDASQTSLAGAIISLGKSMNLRAVAEGVETSEQAAILAALGCQLAQGYYFARPTDAAGIDAFLSSSQPARPHGEPATQRG